MVLNIVKYAVGVENIEQLKCKQIECKKRFGRVLSLTSLAPRRADEILAGGSMYWIIKREIRARQRILSIEDKSSESKNKKKIKIILDSILCPTIPTPRRPHQGWRYLSKEQSPPDLEVNGNQIPYDLPESLAIELRRLGLF
ncbi:MAG: lysophospholipase [Rhodospirillaceae bacterium]|nr:lysophospholipase [Rhodospirillaceae bacterium]|tara:strand:- start:2380 stop:2805 length:426 start_codon:yes stop_codon:yes gene_type:complete